MTFLNALLAVVLLLPATSGTLEATEPGPHFQGVGRWTGPDVHTNCPLSDLPPLSQMALIVELVEETYYARFASSCLDYLLYSAFPLTAPLTALASTYVLRGSWESGFIGYGLRCVEYCFIEIDPYGTGRDIAVRGGLSLIGPWFDFEGNLDDLRVV